MRQWLQFGAFNSARCSLFVRTSCYGLKKGNIADGDCMKLWYRTGDVTALRELSRSRVVCLDVETTGRYPRIDEVLQVALVRGDGEALLSRYVRPERHASWPSAQRIHGISPSMVEDCPSLLSLRPEIEKVFKDVDLIVGYNVAFDLLFLKEVGISFGNASVFDVMREFAPVIGRWDAGRQRYAWVPLHLLCEVLRGCFACPRCARGCSGNVGVFLDHD